ncbi:MAG: translational GTPase TypA [Proteobacteria bacterium]|nr:translational GTPase TypA [Pseudomonadota bacterium]MBU1611276.1 translational GTPase TypA [Pseudomonadota bacterium]
MQSTEKLRNVAIIAHVDHGKTTLVDAMFRQAGLFRDNQEVEKRIMDNMDLERERGITISAKNCSVQRGDVKINIIDTPGHADFGGEVERSLSMADGAILLVDAAEGPLPQTRFVLGKALDRGLTIIVVVNKIDRSDARPAEVLDEIYDLFIDLDASEDQLDFPVLYAIGRDGTASHELKTPGENLDPIFDAILNQLPAPKVDSTKAFKMLVADLGYSDYLGRLAVGRVAAGMVHESDQLVCVGENGKPRPLRVTRLQGYNGPRLEPVDGAVAGDIVVLSGIEDVTIGDTIATMDDHAPLPRIRVDEPTVSMTFSINTSPLAGTEGSIVQAGKIYERLQRETLNNVAMRVEKTDDKEAFLVSGRGEFQMAILVEQMRREGFELTVGRPQVIMKHIDGKLQEPIEHVFVDCDEVFMGIVTEKLSMRKGRMSNMVNHGSGRVRIEFSVPSRGLIGYRDEFLTDTKGTGILNSLLEGYGDHRGDFPTRRSGSIVCDRKGKAVAYAIFHLEPRGEIIVEPGDPVYDGMVVGERNKAGDIDVNPTKEKKLTNMRASGKDEAIILTPVKPMTLERALHFIAEDELVEVTPKSIRLRKIALTAQDRRRGEKIKKGIA